VVLAVLPTASSNNVGRKNSTLNTEGYHRRSNSPSTQKEHSTVVHASRAKYGRRLFAVLPMTSVRKRVLDKVQLPSAQLQGRTIRRDEVRGSKLDKVKR